jgi:hypothetical protein
MYNKPSMISLRLVPLFWAAISLCLGAQIAKADEFCAVTLNVEGPDHRPISSTWIELDDPSGHLLRKEMMVGPALRICDFGFGPHTLRVGTNECLPVTISNLQVVIGRPVHLDVTLNPCGYSEILLRSACLLYLRVTDSEGKPLPGVTLSPGVAGGPVVTMDSYGRFQTLVAGSRDLVLYKDGFEDQSVHVTCRDKEEIDRPILMRRLP